MKLYKHFLLGMFMLWQGAEFACADLTIFAMPAPDRNLAVSATDFPGVASDGHSSSATGSYIHAVSVTGTGPHGSVTASADQGSDTPMPTGPSMGGMGTGTITVTPPGPPDPPGFSFTSRSVFDMHFGVVVSGIYTFDAKVEWADTFPGGMLSGITFVDLTDVSAALSLARVDKGPGDTGVESLLTPVALSAGTPYRLEAKLFMAGGGPPGSYTASAKWTVSLSASAIPEAGSVAMMTLTTLGAAFCAWRRRQR